MVPTHINDLRSIEMYLMRKIGLGAHYWYFNGWEGCKRLRLQIVSRMAYEIQQYQLQGNIASPDAYLLSILDQVAKDGEKDDYTLTNTWIVASEVIKAHIDVAFMPEQIQKQHFKNLGKRILDQIFNR